jgi:hypothetical protein
LHKPGEIFPAACHPEKYCSRIRQNRAFRQPLQALKKNGPRGFNCGFLASGGVKQVSFQEHQWKKCRADRMLDVYGKTKREAIDLINRLSLHVT